MATHANDVVLLPIIFIPISKLRSLSVEDNFNNTFALHSGVASQRYKSFSDNTYMLRKIFFQKKFCTKLPNLVIFIIFAPRNEYHYCMKITFKDKALSDLYENGKTEDRKYKKICRNID